MDVILDLLLTLAKALINQSIVFLFSKISSKKSKKKTTRKPTKREWSSKNKVD